MYIFVLPCMKNSKVAKIGFIHKSFDRQNIYLVSLSTFLKKQHDSMLCALANAIEKSQVSTS